MKNNIGIYIRILDIWDRVILCENVIKTNKDCGKMGKKFASRTEVAQILDIDRRTFSNYCNGKRRVTNRGVRKKLFEITGIEFFRSEISDMRECISLAKWADLYIEQPSHKKNGNEHYDKDDSDIEDDHKIVVDNSKTPLEDKDVSTDSHKCYTVKSPDRGNLKVFTDDKDNLGGIDRSFIDTASALRNWYNGQTKWVSQKEIADYVCVSHSSIKRIFQGRTKPRGTVKQKLCEITQLECFRDDKQEKSAHVEKVNVRTEEAKSYVDKAGSSVCKVDTSVDSPFPGVATELRNWFNNQYIWKKQKEIADHIGISNSSMKKMFQGVKKPEGIVRQKLYDITQLECFRNDQQEKCVSVEEKNVCIEEVKVCVNKVGLPIYEAETSIGKKNGQTKKMKIPIHEVSTHIIAMNDTVGKMQEPITEIQEPSGNKKVSGGDVGKLAGTFY